VREDLEEGSDGSGNINEQSPVFGLSLHLELLLNLINIRVKGLVRELVLNDHFRETVNVAAGVENNKALFEGLNLLGHEVDQAFEDYLLGFGHLLSSLWVSATLG
jgi:hypothetical protein